MILVQLGNVSLGVEDMVMLGHVGVAELDAAALGNLWLFGTMIFGIGLMLGLDPIISQAHGAGQGQHMGRAVQQGIVLAMAISVPIGGMWLVTEEILVAAGQSPALAGQAELYNLVQLPCLPMLLSFNAFRVFLQGRGIAAPVLWVTVLANGFNIFTNWVLIYGNLGFPALGLYGAGLATSITRGATLVVLVSWIWLAGLHRGAWQPWSRSAFNPAGLRRILRYGLPVGFQYLLEVWAFQISTLMAGRLGEYPLAAHSIVLNLASVAFMVPLGVSIGAAVRVGNRVGAGDARGARRMAWLSVGVGAATMTVSAILFIVLRHSLPLLYNDDPDVVALAVTILPIAAAFQLFDGIQVVAGGVLRGYGNTRPAALFNFMGYYLLSLPFAAYLTFYAGVHLAGIWWGLVVGLALVSLMLVVWIAVQSRQV